MSQKSFVMQLPQFVPKALTSDMVISDNDGKMKMVDVKRRPFVGQKNHVARATVSKRQRELGVEILYVLHDGTIRWEADL